jgi:hypothetical protein
LYLQTPLLSLLKVKIEKEIEDTRVKIEEKIEDTKVKIEY